MGRLLPLLLLIGMIVSFALAVRNIGQQQRGRNTYRPRPKWWDPFGGSDRTGSDVAPGTVHIVRRSELAGVRDAYSSDEIDLSRTLFRCGACQAFYHEASVSALRQENQGRCAVCGSSDIGPVRLADE